MNQTRLLILISSFSLLLLLQAAAKNFPFEIITNLNDAKVLMIYNDTLYAATTGGFVIYPMENNDFEVWTTEHGITDHNFRALFESDKGIIIVGTLDGTISFYYKSNQTIVEDFNLQGEEIKSICSIADTLWIASRKLVAVYLFNPDKNKFEFRDFYSNFNTHFNSFEQILYHDGKIWIASDNGLLYAQGNFLRFNLKSADNWKTLSGLSDNIIYSLAQNTDTLLIGTQNGLFKYIHDTYVNIKSGLVGTDLRHIKIKNNKIYVDNKSHIYQLNSDHFTSIYTSSVSNINDFDLDSSGNVWISISERGLLNATQQKSMRFNGPIDNILGEIYLDNSGKLWVLTNIFGDASPRGFSVLLQDGIWKNYRHMKDWYPTASAQAITEDANGNIWIGSWNGGLTIIDPNLKFYHFNNYTTSGELWVYSILEEDTLIYDAPDSVRHFISYTGDYPDLLVVTDLLFDNTHQSIWLSLYRAGNGKPLVNYPLPTFSDQAFDSLTWQRMSIPSNLQEPNNLAALTQDIFDNLWIGTVRDGAVTRQLNDTGGYNWFNINEDDNLKSNSCLSIAGDQDGYVWLGTKAGLNAYINGNLFDLREDYQPIGLKINEIFVDTQNNKWFATDRGLSLLRASGSPWDPNSWVHFVPKRSELIGANIYPSNLPSEVIRSVFVDDRTGDVYCTTLSGLAILRSNPFTTPLPTLDKVKIGPVPLIIGDKKNNFLFFRNLTGNCQVKILTSTGRLVRTLDRSDIDEILGSLAQWDGKNDEGRFVSSGVYLYLITDENGNAANGKFLVIRD